MVIEEWIIVYSILCNSGHIFSEIQKKILALNFFNGDDVRSRNNTESQSALALLHLRQKKKRIRATNHKGEHVLTSRTLSNQDIFLIPTGDKVVY